MSTSQSGSTALTLTHTTTIISPDGAVEQEEQLAIETPYSIALNDETIGSSMVLPVGLEEFGAGFLFGQGYIKTPEDIKEIYVCPEGRIAVYGDIEVTEPKEVIITSGCGGTGKISKEMLEGAFEPLQDYTMTFPEINAFIRQALHTSTLGHDTHCTQHYRITHRCRQCGNAVIFGKPQGHANGEQQRQIAENCPAGCFHNLVDYIREDCKSRAAHTKQDTGRRKDGNRQHKGLADFLQKGK